MIQQERAIYDRAPVDPVTGEIQEFDSVLFNRVVRGGEIEFIAKSLAGRGRLQVLDLGCGGGWLTRTLVRMGHDAVGVDVSGGILSTAAAADEIKGHLVQADGHELPFRKGTFDAVVCVGALHHTELGRLLPGLARVTKSNGSLVFLEPNRLNPLSEIGRRLFPMTTHTPGERPYTPNQLRRAFSDAGWEVQEYRTLFLYTFALSYILHKTTANRLASVVAPLVDRHERHLMRWLSILPVGAVILGKAEFRGANSPVSEVS